MKKFPWNCGDCPMLKTYDMSIDDLTHICLWSKNQIDDCDRYQSAECPLEKHNSELLDKVYTELEQYKRETNLANTPWNFIELVFSKMKAEVADNEFFNFDKVIEIEKSKSYQQGAKEFAEWLLHHSMLCDSLGQDLNDDDLLTESEIIDEILADWQKEKNK